MGDPERTLVMILASALAVFLLLAIIATVKIIQILNHLKSISEKAEKLADAAENIGQFFTYTGGTAAIGKLISNIVESFHNRKKTKE